MYTLRPEAYCRSVGQDDYSPNGPVNQAIQWLLDSGYPVLPIAPSNEQAVVKGKRLYSGKNPSYLDRYARATLVNHRQFQYRLPRRDEIKRWFQHEATGVATMGGWQQTIWIDIDRKHFPTTEVCYAVVRRLLQHGSLQQTFLECTPSGGFHIGVRCRQPPDFTRCCLGRTQLTLGELLGAGKVCVLAPTQGADGRYESLQRTAPVWIDSVADLGIAPKQALTTRPPRWRDNTQVVYHRPLASTVPLDRLFSERVQTIVSSQPDKGERSEALTAVAREAFGWEWFVSQHGVQVRPDAESFCFALGQQWELDTNRVQRILDSTSCGRPVRQSTPGLYTVRGTDACLSKLRWASRSSFEPFV